MTCSYQTERTLTKQNALLPNRTHSYQTERTLTKQKAQPLSPNSNNTIYTFNPNYNTSRGLIICFLKSQPSRSMFLKGHWRKQKRHERQGETSAHQRVYYDKNNLTFVVISMNRRGSFNNHTLDIV